MDEIPREPIVSDDEKGLWVQPLEPANDDEADYAMHFAIAAMNARREQLASGQPVSRPVGADDADPELRSDAIQAPQWLAGWETIGKHPPRIHGKSMAFQKWTSSPFQAISPTHAHSRTLAGTCFESACRRFESVRARSR